MKKIKFFLAAFAAMFGLGAQAQTWTGNPIAEGSFYLYNVGAQKFLNNGDPLQDWGTNSYLQAGFGMDVVIAEVSAGVYTIDTNVSNGGNSHYLANNLWCDGGATNWTFRAVDGETNTYQIVFDGQYMMANEALNDVEMVSDPGSRTTSTYWKLVTEDDFRAAMVAKEYSASEPMDVSIFIKGRSFARNDGRNSSWTRTNTDGQWIEEKGTNAHYQGNEYYYKVFDVYQNLTRMPEGTYEVRCSGFGTSGTTYVYGNSQKGYLTTENSAANGDRAIAYRLIADENAWAGQSSGTFTVGDGNIRVGVANEDGQGWTVYDEFRLYYYGLDLSEFAATLATAVAAAEAVEEGTIPTAAYNALAAVISEQNKTYTTAAEYTDATNAIIEATNIAKAIQADYARYNSIKAAALAISDDVDTTAADTEVEAATTTAAIDAAIVTLRAAFLTELPNVAIPNDPGYIDVTAVMVDNASVHQNTNYWTIEGTPNGGYSWAVCNYDECEFYQQNFKFYQTLALTRGTWEFGVTGFHRNGNHSTYFYAGEDQILIPGVASDVVNSMAGAQTYFDAGNGKVSLKFLIETAEDVEIGINNQDTETDKWTIFRDFTLKYYGAPDYSVYQDQWDAAVVAANTAKNDAANANVTGQELTDLNTAISNAPNGSSLKADYLAKINALTAATTAFINAKAAYDTFAEVKTKVYEELPYASSTKYAAIATVQEETTAATSAADAADKTNAILSAYRKYVESNALAEGVAGAENKTSLISDPNMEVTYDGTAHTFGAWQVIGQTNGTIKLLSSESFTDGDGNSNYKYADIYKSDNNAGIQQTLSDLAPGRYILTVTARANTTAGASFKIFAGAANAEIQRIGNSGGVFDRGWNDATLVFDVLTESDVNIGVQSGNGKDLWWSATRFRLARLGNVPVSIDENVDYAATEATSVDVTLTRTIKADVWNTFVVPFDITNAELKTAFGDDVEVAEFSDGGASEDAVTVSFTKMGTPAITANTPVLLKSSTAGTSYSFTNRSVVTGTTTIAGTYVDFVGTYNASTTITEGNYFISGNKLWKSSGATTINGTRAYIDAKNVASVRLFIDDVETGIEAINGVEAENGAIYNIAGQRLGKMQKGINIVNGKKIIK